MRMWKAAGAVECQEVLDMKTMTIVASVLLYCGAAGSGVTGSAAGSMAAGSMARRHTCNPDGGAAVKAGSQDKASTLSNLVRSLGSSDPNARATAACQLGKMHAAAEPAIPSLIKLLADTTVVDFNGCDDQQNFGRHSGDPDDQETVGKVAAVALSQIGKAAIDPLIEALRAPEVAARANSAFALGLVHDERVVEPLVGALSDGDFHVRKMAAWSLGLAGDSRAVGPLAGALKDPAWQVRSNAAWALGLKGDNRAVDGLMAALKDQSGHVRSQAAWALGLKGDQRAAQALADAMKDEDAHVRKQASWALGMIMMRGGDFSGLNIDTSQIKVRKK